MDVFANSLDDVSAGSSTEFPDRLSLMEARLQTQEDEMMLLKSALSDTLRRLRVYDEQIPLLRQHILAGNPAAGRGCSCVSDGAFSHRKLSTSSNPDWPKRSSSQRFRRNSSSDKLAKEQQDKAKQKLGKKAVSSANLLTRSPSVENRTKDLVSSSGSSGSRRGTYSQGLSIKMFIRGRPITMYIPSNIQNYEELRMEPPTERLELDWVYPLVGGSVRAGLWDFIATLYRDGFSL